MKYVNWRRFWLCFAILEVVVFCAGCSASWLGAVSALLPALESAIAAALSFVAALNGKTVSASVTASIQKIGEDVKAQIANVQALIADYKNAATTGLLSQIQAVFQGITDNLASILSSFNVTDQASVSKFTALIGLAVAAAQSIVALLPLVAAKLASNESPAQLETEDKLAAASVNSVHDGLKQAYQAIRNTATDSKDVNAALKTLPASLP